MKSVTRTAFALILLLIAPPLHAFDATGTWEGQYSCKELDDGEKFTFKMKPSTLLITQSGSTVFSSLDGDSFHYDGFAIDDLKKPGEKGEILLVDCASDDDAGAGFAEMIRAVVKTKPNKITASFSGVSVFQDVTPGFLTFGSCKYKFKRTSLTNPNVGSCP